MKMEEENYMQPLFPIGIVANMFSVTQTTLRIWEKKGLIKPQRLGKNRYYSHYDLDRLKEIKCLLNERKMNIAGVKGILSLERCWEIKECGSEKYNCAVYLEKEEKKGNPFH